MASLDPSVKVRQDWAGPRRAEARALNIPEPAITQIANYDIAKVDAGSQPLAPDAAISALLAAAGRAPITPKDSGNVPLTSIPGHAVSDLGNILWHFPRAVAQTVYHLPSELRTVGDLMGLGGGQAEAQARQKVGWENYDPNKGVGSNVAAFLRDLGRTPLVNLAPGVSDVGQLTTSEGRKALERHPVGAALDVLPLAQEAGKLAVAGDVSAAETAAATDASLLGKNYGPRQLHEEAVSTLSPLKQSLATGHPLAALLDAIPGARPLITKLQETYHIDPNSMRAYAAITEAKRLSKASFNAFSKDLGTKLVTNNLTPEEFAQFLNERDTFTATEQPFSKPEWHVLHQTLTEMEQSINSLRNAGKEFWDTTKRDLTKEPSPQEVAADTFKVTLDKGPDIQFQLEEAYRKALETSAVSKTLGKWMPKMSATAETLLEKFRSERPENANATLSTPAFQKWIRGNFVEAGTVPGRFSQITFETLVRGKLGGVYIGKNLAESIKSALESKPLGEGGKLAAKATHLYKVSIFAMSPKFIEHTVGGGMLMTMLRSGVHTWDPEVLATAFRLAHDPEGAMADLQRVAPKLWEQLRGTSRGARFPDSDAVTQIAIGKTLGRIAQKYGNIGYKIAGFSSDLYRAAIALGEYQKLIGSGEDAAYAAEQASQLAEKTITSFNNLTPVEQRLTETILPFYPFLKHVLRYTLSYPIDFPIRAQVLAAAAELDKARSNPLEPDTWSTLFHWGQPDQNGNIFTIDARGLDPFRNMSSIFTLSGFISQLDPAFRSLFDAAGFNTVSGTAELFPNLSIDETTGQLVAAHPPDAPMTFLEGIIPEAALYQYLNQSKTLADLHKHNPEAYRKYLYSLLNIPYLGATSPSLDYAKQELNRFRIAQSDVANAVKSGDTSAISGYSGLVPYHGRLAHPQSISALLSFYDKLAKRRNESPRNVIPSTVRLP